MFDQDNNFYLLSMNILIICLLDNVKHQKKEFHVDHFWELKDWGTVTRKGPTMPLGLVACICMLFSYMHIWFSIYLICFPVFHSTSNNSNIIKTHLWILLKSLHCYLCLTFWCTTSLSDIILTLYKFSCVFRVHTQYTSRTFGTRQLCILLRTTHISVFITFVTLNFNNHDDI